MTLGELPWECSPQAAAQCCNPLGVTAGKWLSEALNLDLLSWVCGPLVVCTVEHPGAAPAPVCLGQTLQVGEPGA